MVHVAVLSESNPSHQPQRIPDTQSQTQNQDDQLPESPLFPVFYLVEEVEDDKNDDDFQQEHDFRPRQTYQEAWKDVLLPITVVADCRVGRRGVKQVGRQETCVYR